MDKETIESIARFSFGFLFLMVIIWAPMFFLNLNNTKKEKRQHKNNG